VSEALAHLTLIVFTKLSAAKTEARVYINTTNAEGPVLPFDNAKEKILAISSFDPEWNYHKILERVKATCFSKQRYDFPNYRLGPFKVAQHLR